MLNYRQFLFGGNFMKLLEPLYYESLPYVYGALAIFAFSQADESKIAGVAALLLSFCSCYILKKRFEYRSCKGRARKF